MNNRLSLTIMMPSILHKYYAPYQKIFVKEDKKSTSKSATSGRQNCLMQGGKITNNKKNDNYGYTARIERNPQQSLLQGLW